MPLRTNSLNKYVYPTQHPYTGSGRAIRINEITQLAMLSIFEEGAGKNV